MATNKASKHLGQPCILHILILLRNNICFISSENKRKEYCYFVKMFQVQKSALVYQYCQNTILLSASCTPKQNSCETDYCQLEGAKDVPQHHKEDRQ